MGEPTTAEKMGVLLQPELVHAAKEYLLMHPKSQRLNVESLAMVARWYGVSQRSLRLAIRVVRSIEKPAA